MNKLIVNIFPWPTLNIMIAIIYCRNGKVYMERR